MAGFNNQTVLCTNIETTASMTTNGSFQVNGQLLIGGTASPKMAVAQPTASNGVAWTYGQNSLAIAGINASETQIGVVELATNAETIAGADTQRAVVPSALAAKLGAQTANAIAVAAGPAQPLSYVGPLSNGQLLIGSTGAAPVAASLTAGANITITPGPGTLTIASTGGGGSGLTWNFVSASTTMVPDNGYVLTGGANQVFTLPAVAAQGTLLRVVSAGSALWSIAQQAGQQIRFGGVNSTLGITGGLAARDPGDGVQLLCIVANTIWLAIDSFGNITVN